MLREPPLAVLGMEIEITLQPKQKEAFKKSLVTPVLFYGGAKGGGKSYLIRAKELYRRLKYPKTKGLIVRKTYPELLSNHIRKLFEEYPITRDWYNKSEKILYYPNGSITEFSYLQSTDDVYTYQGRDYEDISVDEITQHEEEVYKILKTSLRTSNPNLREMGFIPSMLLTGNPGGIGHMWVKRLFVDKLYKPEESPDQYDFVQAFVQDNQALLRADPDYIKRLNDLPEHLRRAYLEGDWNVHAGQAFSELNYHVHVIEPFELPINTRYFAGFDWGYNHPFSFVVFAIVEDGTVYVIKHYTDRNKRPDEVAKGILEFTKGLSPINIYAGLDLWSHHQGGPAIVDQFMENGVNKNNGCFIVKAYDDRIQRVASVRKYIAYKNTADNKPKLFFFRNTLDVFNCVSAMQFDAKRPEDVLKMDADSDGIGGDDSYDAFSYGLNTWLNAPDPRKVEYPKDSAMRLFDEVVREAELRRRLSSW